MITNDRPWEELQSLIRGNEPDQVRIFLNNLNSEDIVRSMIRLKKGDRRKLMTLISPQEAADIIDDIHDTQAADIIDDLEVKEAAAILNEMHSDDQVDILSELDKEDAEAIIHNMEPGEAESVRRLIQYEPDTAGGLMITEYLSFDENMTVGEVVRHLRKHSARLGEFSIKYIYVVSGNVFVGVLQMVDLLLSPELKKLSKIVNRNTLTVRDTDTINELSSFFNTYDFYGVPVLDDQNELVGVVLRKSILEAGMEKATMNLLETQGIVGGEELRTYPLHKRSGRRLSWLSVNIVLNIIAASVIAFYQETLSSVIALAVFLPIISDMSGCSGNQAVAVSMRELSLGLVKPNEVFRVWFQEISVGLINGIVLGILIGLAAFLWKGNMYLGFVVGGALTLNTMLAVSLGGTIPLLLKRFGIDPALASSPILTTITDMFGFFLALSFASIALSHING
jgi:magnesium transporter